MVLDTLYGNSGLIVFPSAISGEVYVADMTTTASQSGAVIRSYYPGTTDNIIFPSELSRVYGMNPVFDGTKLAMIASNTVDGTSKQYLYIYTPAADTWTSGTPLTGEASDWLPYTYSISGDATTIIGCFKNSTTGAWGVHMYFTTSGDDLSAWTQLTTDDVEIPSGYVPIDMVLATVRDGTSVGKVFIYCATGYGAASSVSSVIHVFTLPATDPYTSGTWTSSTPSYIGSHSTCAVNSGYCHQGLAVVERSGTDTDDVFAKYFIVGG